jgi:hypothetical protein
MVFHSAVTEFHLSFPQAYYPNTHSHTLEHSSHQHCTPAHPPSPWVDHHTMQTRNNSIRTPRQIKLWELTKTSFFEMLSLRGRNRQTGDGKNYWLVFI